MAYEQFVALHPAFSWWMGALLLVFLLTACFTLWKIKHPPAEHTERHDHQGVLLGMLLGGSVAGFVFWVCWLLWRAHFYAWLHSVLHVAP